MNKTRLVILVTSVLMVLFGAYRFGDVYFNMLSIALGVCAIPFINVIDDMLKDKQ